jgi:hypothetical protein
VYNNILVLEGEVLGGLWGGGIGINVGIWGGGGGGGGDKEMKI